MAPDRGGHGPLAAREGFGVMGLVLVLASVCLGGGLLMLTVGLIEQTGLADWLLERMERPHGGLLWSDGEEDER